MLGFVKSVSQPEGEWNMVTAKKIARSAAIGLLIYLLYAIVFGVLSYSHPQTVSKQFADSFQVSSFFAEEETRGVDRVMLLEQPSLAFDERIRLIEQAKHTLDISYQSIHWGQCAEYLLGSVLSAADRGVQVRIVLDGKMGGLTGKQKDVAYALSLHPNIEYKVYNTFHILMPWQWNVTLHDQYMIADDRLLILGGRNIGDQYFDSFGYEGAVVNSRDVLVYNSGHDRQQGGRSVLQQAKAYMDKVWDDTATTLRYSKLSQRKQAEGTRRAGQLRESYHKLKTIRPELFAGTAGDYHSRTLPAGRVRLVHNPLNRSKKEPWVGWQLMQLAKQAEHSVVVQTPYTIAGQGTMQLFEELRQKGIQFDLVTNSEGTASNNLAYSYYMLQRDQLYRTGPRVFEFQGANTIHGKSFLFDNRLSAVGSFNLDERSLHINTETMLVIDSPEFNSALTNAVDRYKKQSLVVGKNGAYLPCPTVEAQQVPFGKQFRIWVLSLLSRGISFLI